MKSLLKKILLVSVLALVSISGYSQNSNVIFSFDLGDAGLFNKDNDNNLYATIIIENLDAAEFNTFVEKFKNNTGVIEFKPVQSEKGIFKVSAKFKKADLDYFYKLFKDNGVAAIKANGKLTKVEYLELKTDIMPEPASFKNYSDPNSIDYYNKRIADAEYKINWVQHDRNEIKKAIKSGWFEEADQTLTQLKNEKETFLKQNPGQK